MSKRKSDEVTVSVKIQKTMVEKDWTQHVFHLNQLAFAVWNYLTICEVLLLSAVQSSWKNRIWQFEDRSVESRVKSGAMKRKKNQKLHKMKLSSVQTSIANILQASSKTVTSSSNQYLFQCQMISFHNKMPLNSRLSAICCLVSNLRELELNNPCKMSNTIGLQRMDIITANCNKIEVLYLHECGVNEKLFPFLERLVNLRKIVLQDRGPAEIEYYISLDQLYSFYCACAKLVEVALLTRYLDVYAEVEFDQLCDERWPERIRLRDCGTSGGRKRYRPQNCSPHAI